jgi:nicotinamidase-related amidase
MDDAAPPPLPRSPELMDAATTCLLVVDLQPSFLRVQPQARRIVFNALRLLEAARLLGVAVAATEQSPEKLGATVDEVAALLPGPALRKTQFRATACGGLALQGVRPGVEHVALCGIETHICVQQTALDLLSVGYRVQLVVDAVGSRFPQDRDVALRRMESAGASLTTTEAALFEWCVDADRPEFKALSALAKRVAPDAAG